MSYLGDATRTLTDTAASYVYSAWGQGGLSVGVCDEGYRSGRLSDVDPDLFAEF